MLSVVALNVLLLEDASDLILNVEWILIFNKNAVLPKEAWKKKGKSGCLFSFFFLLLFLNFVD